MTEVHEAAGRHPSFRTIAVATLVLVALLCILVPWAIVSANGAAAASELVARNAAVLSCRAEYAADVDAAQVTLDEARAALDESRAEREVYESDLLAAAVAGDAGRIVEIVNQRADSTLAALTHGVDRVVEAVHRKRQAVDRRADAIDRSVEDPSAFAKRCRA